MKTSFSHTIKHLGCKIFVYEKGKNFSFNGKRFFIIHGRKGQLRGRHAHKKHKQLLICLQGKCEVHLDNGFRRHKVILSGPDKSIEIKPMIWSEQLYKTKNTQIAVLSDYRFDESDYIRDYKIFLKEINEKK